MPVKGEPRPALLTVVGPAGVGKTRLVSEPERYVEGFPELVYWRRGRCLAYGNTSYSALADAVKAQSEILEDDASDVALKQTEHAVRALFGDTEVAPAIAALVGAGEPGSFSREDLFEACAGSWSGWPPGIRFVSTFMQVQRATAAPRS